MGFAFFRSRLEHAGEELVHRRVRVFGVLHEDAVARIVNFQKRDILP